MTATQTAPKYRYIGVTDECVQCECCGKPNLKSTVVIAILDADGNADEITYYGSTCAAKALSVRGGGTAVLKAARWATEKTIQDARDAAKRLAFWGWPETGRPEASTAATALDVWMEKNSSFAQDNTRAACNEAMFEARGRDQAAIAAAALIAA